jgi:DNA mismatch repair protein MutS
MNDMGHIEDRAKDAAVARPTPVMAQFQEIKAANPGCLLFYRMGDFYELFFEDAEIAARGLGIALTKRGKHLGEDIPMCGVPVHTSEAYLQKLIRLGHRVAVCEQLEDPAEARKRGAKAVVRRDVVRLVTPGTLTEDNLLDSRSANHLVALSRLKGSGDLAIAWTDISSGDLAVMLSSAGSLGADLARLDPREIVLADSLLLDTDVNRIVERLGSPVTPLPSARFDSVAGERRLKDHFAVAALEGFGRFSRSEISALGGLLEYVLMTQAGRAPHLRQPRQELPSSVLLIDPATRANLELTRTVTGDRRGSLLSVIDEAMTAAGSRCLAARLANPLSDHVAIAARLDQVAFFVAERKLRCDIRLTLGQMPDLERALGRITIGRGTPRDLAVVRDALKAASGLASMLACHVSIAGLPRDIGAIQLSLTGGDGYIASELSLSLAEDLPVTVADGGFIRSGYSSDLDENRLLRDETRQIVAGLQARYSGETGIKSLKIRHNNVLGYFIEVPAASASGLSSPENVGRFIHRQTVAAALRFVTTELASLDQRIAAAGDRAIAIEKDIFNRFVTMINAQRDILSTIAQSAAELDAASALAELAERRRYVRPVTDNSTAFSIKAGRHPVVEAVLQDTATGSFVSNDCELPGGGQRLCLLTGPNMAGKSTFLRQNALIVILAQMGSFVPAAEAHIGVVDRLFSRVGASDDLARGRSTFMVEMVETAAILNQATERSFVILDEIGRGTATYDGLSIAWAALEHLHGVNRCRALFATHYHELTVLASKLPHLANATVKVREWKDEIIFLHEVAAGIADRSYGLHVARLAGLPLPVVVRAEAILKRLEAGQTKTGPAIFIDDLPLFAAATAGQNPYANEQFKRIETKLAAAAPDEMSPRDALEFIYELKALMAGKQ